MRNCLLALLLPVLAWASNEDDIGYNWKCNLYCYNGGKCRHGKGKFGAYAGVEEPDVLPWEQEVVSGVGMSCLCPVGYTGLQCEIAMKICGNDEHTCFNGAPCVRESDFDGRAWWRCECDVANSVMSEQYAGKYCEHVATVFCDKKANEIDPGQNYCTNGGKCKEKDHAGQTRVGCICQPGFEGHHCEISTITHQKTFSDLASEASNTNVVGLSVGIVVSLVFVVTAFLYWRDQKNKGKARRRRRMRSAGIETPQSFRGTSTGEIA